MFTTKTFNTYVFIDNQKPAYRPGDELKGNFCFWVKHSISVKKISCSFRGAILTRLSNTEPKADDNIGFDDIITQDVVIFPTEESTGDTMKLSRGDHNYDFSFKIPSGMLPSSYEGKYGAIRYWLSFDIERTALRSHIRRPLIITVLDDIDVNLPEYSKYVAGDTEKSLTNTPGFGNQENKDVVSLCAQTDRGAYCPGEKMFIKYIAENKSDKDLGIVNIQLMQEVKFRAIGEEKRIHKCLKEISGGEMKKGIKLMSLDEENFIKVPAIPPSTRDRSCHLIIVQYYVKVIIDIPKIYGGDCMIILPVTIGTIPQGTEAEVQGASNIQAVDGTSAFTYFMYEDGFEDNSTVWSSKLNFNFPTLPYVPLCPYVFDFIRPKENTTDANLATALANAANGINEPVEIRLPSKAEEAFATSAIDSSLQVQPSDPSANQQPPTYEEVMKGLERYPDQTLHGDRRPREQLSDSFEDKTEGEESSDH